MGIWWYKTLKNSQIETLLNPITAAIVVILLAQLVRLVRLTDWYGQTEDLRNVFKTHAK